jgi:molybdopterin converting factor subunit 1
MRVRVLLFAIIREAAQTSEVDLELPSGATASDAAKSVESQFPPISKYLARAGIAVNRQYANAKTTLADGDEVAIIPPVSGG